MLRIAASRVHFQNYSGRPFSAQAIGSARESAINQFVIGQIRVSLRSVVGKVKLGQSHIKLR